MQWQPTANIEALKKRAQITQQIREFFAERQVLEVDTPLMCHTSIPDPNIHSIPALYQAYGEDGTQMYYLQTSPEFAMKRLLVAGIGSIYQICKAFRNGDYGRFHNPEFTMLEWYRIGFNMQQLMQEVDELLQLILKTKPAEMVTYQELFLQTLGVDPLNTSIENLKKIAEKHDVHMVGELDLDGWLQCLMSHAIEPKLGFDKPVMISHFPASQAALARVDENDPKVAHRFEVYVQGLELANGFYELSDAEEQRSRFQENLRQREKMQLPLLPLDEKFLTALEKGFPDCSGVALGVDRLIMLALNANAIREVLAFDFVSS